MAHLSLTKVGRKGMKWGTLGQLRPFISHVAVPTTALYGPFQARIGRQESAHDSVGVALCAWFRRCVFGDTASGWLHRGPAARGSGQAAR